MLAQALKELLISNSTVIQYVKSSKKNSFKIIPLKFKIINMPGNNKGSYIDEKYEIQNENGSTIKDGLIDKNGEIEIKDYKIIKDAKAVVILGYKYSLELTSELDINKKLNAMGFASDDMSNNDLNSKNNDDIPVRRFQSTLGSKIDGDSANTKDKIDNAFEECKLKK